MLRPSRYPSSRSPCAMGSKEANPNNLDSYDKYPTLGSFVGGCAPAASGASIRPIARTSPISRMGTSVEDGWWESSRPELLAVCGLQRSTDDRPARGHPDL